MDNFCSAVSDRCFAARNREDGRRSSRSPRAAEGGATASSEPRGGDQRGRQTLLHTRHCQVSALRGDTKSVAMGTTFRNEMFISTAQSG